MGKVFFSLVVLLALAIGLGFYLGWFNVSLQRNAPDDKKVTLGVEVDKEKIKQDTQAVEKQAKGIGKTVTEKVQGLTKGETVKGTVVKVEAAEQRFTMMTGDRKELTITMGPASKIRLKEAELHLTDLKAGDVVSVVYKVTDGKNVAESVTVERGA
jgi:hypothetical protein